MQVVITYERISTFIGAVLLENIAIIAVDRYLALRLRLRYRQVVKLGRVLLILVLEWIMAAIFAGSRFLNGSINLLSGAFALFINFFLIALYYICIYRSIRRHFAQIHHQTNSTGTGSDFNVVQYKKTVNNSLWIFGVFAMCYAPSLLMSVVLVVKGLDDSTRFGLQFGTIAVYFNSMLNTILYCWKIKELKDRVTVLFRALSNFQFNRMQ